MSDTAPDNLELPTLVLSDDRQQRGALKFGNTFDEVLLSVPALPEPGDIPSPPAKRGESGQLFIPSIEDTLCLQVEISATAIDHVTLNIINSSEQDQDRLRQRVRGRPRKVVDTTTQTVELTPQHKRAVLAQIDRYILDQLNDLFRSLFDELVADLQNGSTNPKLLPTQQELLFEGMRQVELVKPRMLELLARDLQRRLEGSAEPRITASKKRIDQIKQEELDLIDLREFEESLAVKRLLRIGEDHHRGAFELTTVRYALLKDIAPRFGLLPLSLNILIPSLKRALNQREIPKELGHRVFEFCGNLLLRRVKTLYANINNALKQAGIGEGIEHRLESGAPLLSPPSLGAQRLVKPSSKPSPNQANIEPNLSDLASTLPQTDTVTLQVAKDKAAFIERLMASMGDEVDPNRFSDQLVADMFAQVRDDTDTHPALSPAIESLQAPLQAIARDDPTFLVNSQHPMRRAFDQLTQLARADLYPNPKLQERVLTLVAQLQDKHEVNPSLTRELAEQTAAIRQQQQRQFLRNIERLRQVENGQVRYREARLTILRLLQDTLPDTLIPQSLANIITNGWLELLTLHQLRNPQSSAEANTIQNDITTLLNALDNNTQDSAPRTSGIPRAHALLDVIEREINHALPTRVTHVRHLDTLRKELSGLEQTALVSVYDTGLFSELSGTNLRDRLRALPRLNRLVQRALALPIDSWLHDKRQGKRVYLAWRDEQRVHFTFANERGQKAYDLSLLEFARALHRDLQPLRPIEELPLIDKHLLKKIQEFVPRQLRHPDYLANSSALTATALAQQVALSSQQAIEQGQQMHIAVLSSGNVELVARLYDNVILQAYEDLFLQSVTDNLGDDQMLGLIRRGKIAVIFFGQSTVSLRRSLSAMRQQLNLRSIATGTESVALDVHWSTLQIDTNLATQEQAHTALEHLAAIEFSSSIKLSDITDTDATGPERRAQFDHTAITLQAFHSQWLAYQTHLTDKRIDFRIKDLQSGEEIIEPYQFYRPETHAEMDRWRLRTVFSWLQSLVEQEREIPNCVIDIGTASLHDMTFCDAVLDDISEYGVGTNKLYFRIDLQPSDTALERIQEFTQILSDIGCRIIGSNVLNADTKLFTAVSCDLLEITDDRALHDQTQQLKRLDSAQLLGCPLIYCSRQTYAEPPEWLRFSLTGEETARSESKPMAQISRELERLTH